MLDILVFIINRSSAPQNIVPHFVQVQLGPDTFQFIPVPIEARSMFETAEKYNDAAAGIIGFKTFGIDPDKMFPINNITR